MSEPQEHHGPVLDTCGQYDVLDCVPCGFRHLRPIPPPETLDAFYETVYYDSHKADYIEKDFSEESYWRIGFRERLDFIEKNVSGRTLLDVGCGTGRFLCYARERGWRGVGIEPSPRAADRGREDGLTIHTGTLEDYVERRDNRYDVVHLKNVLEHVPDPSRVLRQCRRCLVEGGLLYVEVPNDYNLIQRIGVRIARERKSWICIPDHINYYTFASLGRSLERAGFRIIKRDTTFPMYLFLCVGRNFIRDADVGKRVHRLRMRAEMKLERAGLAFIKRGFYALLSRLGLGRTVIYYCKA